jgi:hypothetical protein
MPTHYEAHGHPIGDGRRFEHVHALPSRGHRAATLAEAHPDLQVGPPPGSPADLRRQAQEWWEQALLLRRQADQAEARHDELLARADQDEQTPPSESERVRRLLEGGLG